MNAFYLFNAQSSSKIEKNISEVTARYYPRCRSIPALISLHSANDDDRKGTIIPSDVEAPVHFLKRFDANLLYNSSSIEKKADILATTDRSLSDVVCLQNAELTRAYLERKLSLSDDNSDKPERGGDPYSWIDNDSRESVDKVMSALYLQNAEVILTYGPDRDLRIRHFFYNLVTMATEHPNLQALEVFVGNIVKWNILDKEGSRLIEQEVFQKANKAVIKIFLQYRIDFHIKKLFGNSAMAALFGNPNVKIGAIKRKKMFDINACNWEQFSALHYAMMDKHFKKVKFLLDRGVDPNLRALPDILTPLTLALWKPTVNPIANAKCAELMLQYGANPFFTSMTASAAFYRCIYAKNSLAGNAPGVYAPTGYLTNLALAYACMHDADGARNKHSKCDRHLRNIDYFVERDDDMLNFYRKRQHELQTLKQHEIRLNLTMFTIASKTGKHLFRLIKNEDEKIITNFIQQCSIDKTIHPYYINAMREHMRQFRKSIAHKNRAMRVIAESAKVLATCFIVLNEIVSYLSYEELLMFQ